MSDNPFIKIKNISHFDNSSTLAKKLQNISGIKKISRWPHKPALIEFNSVAEKLSAVEKIELLRNRKNKGFVVLPCNEDDISSHQRFSVAKTAKKKPRPKGEISDPREVVTPLFSTPYEKQIEMKSQVINVALKKVATNLAKETKRYFYPWMAQSAPLCCSLEKIEEAANTDGYRNKDSRTVGHNKEGELCVGYRVGRTEDGSSNVEKCEAFSHVPNSFNALFSVVENMIRKSGFPAYSYETRKGVWRTITLNSGMRGETIRLTIQINDADLDETEFKNVKEEVLRCLDFDSLPPETENSAKTALLTAVIIQKNRAVSNAAPDSAGNELIKGSTDVIFETLNGIKFRISPDSFFQVNAEMAERLYAKISEWADCDREKTVVLDVCCGTGTIGLTLAKKVAKVIGFELNGPAVADARENALSNGIENSVWFVGPVEKTLSKALSETSWHGDEKIVAIVDPPRAGLPKSVLKCLRATKAVESIVYVSCQPSSWAKDATYLVKPETEKRKGRPFKITRCTGIDLFPQTMHCEMLTLLVRTDKDDVPCCRV